MKIYRVHLRSNWNGGSDTPLAIGLRSYSDVIAFQRGLKTLPKDRDERILDSFVFVKADVAMDKAQYWDDKFKHRYNHFINEGVKKR